MQIKLRRTMTILQEKWVEGARSHTTPLRKVAAVAVIENPYAGRDVEDLQPLIDASPELGRMMAEQAGRVIPLHSVQSYGKGGIVGLAGEQEHANACLTTAFANPMRDLLGGAAAWISSMTKVGGPGTAIDIPMNCRHNIAVRSHYDGVSLVLPDAPLPDEIALILCFADGPRLNARVGGMSFAEALPGG